MRKLLLLLPFICGLVLHVRAQKNVELSSLNREIKISVRLTGEIYYDVACNDEVLPKGNYLQLKLKDKILGGRPKLSGQKQNEIKETSTPVVPLKFSTINSEYNQLLLNFKGNYSAEFRTFNDGIAYRFITHQKGEVEVLGEDLSLQFLTDYLLHSQQPGGFKTAYEEPYTHISSHSWRPSDKMSVLPVLADTRKSYKILTSKSNLSDYPCMFLKGNRTNGIPFIFPKAPLALGEDGDRSFKIEKEAEYIVKISGKRNFPWRYFVITKEDKQLVENIMIYKLADKNQLEDVLWVKPGQVSWEWWDGVTPYGQDVTFKVGRNLETYKYSADFTPKFETPCIIMDGGWAKSTRDLYTLNLGVDPHELIRYGKEKNVGITLWLIWLTVEKNFDLFKTFSEWGIKRVRIDLMDRSDQWVVNYHERVAQGAARHHLFVDFHGPLKPARLEYKYSNVLPYEGVRGTGQMGGCKPENSIYLPFMRNAVGPMDYAPGVMISTQSNIYRSERPNSASIGARAYQMALFVILGSGLQMLADSPILYYRDEDCTRFITQIPVTQDETVVLEAKVGEYVTVAKRKGEKWFVGGMTNDKENEGEFEINLDFLKDGRIYRAASFEDGIDAGYQAMDYRMKSATMNKNRKLSTKMARNGGFAAAPE